MNNNFEYPERFSKCADFHGHICPGLSIGYKIALAGLEWLNENRSEDEEIVSIVETDSCMVDAIQVLTGCTAGKGNLIFRDIGKTAATFMSRATGRGVRCILKPDALNIDDGHRELLEKVMIGTADESETAKFREIHTERSQIVLSMKTEELFDIKEVKKELPSRAIMKPSVPCDNCGEAVMSTKLENINNKKLCRDCAENY